MASQQVPLSSPIKGVVRAVNREGQPPETCWDAQNCLPYDRYLRKRLSQRPGLAKEYPNQMSDNFVQGMLEAPNIIYPPGTIDEDVPIIQNLADPFTFSGPTDVGPLTGPMPTAGATVLYAWDFSFTYTYTATPTDPTWFSGGEGQAIFYWPLGSGSTDDLILQIFFGALLGTDTGGGNPNGLEVNMQVQTGDITNDGTWSPVIAEASAPVYGTAVPAGPDTSATITLACSIIINSNGTITIDMTPTTARPGPTSGSSPISQTEFPELALHGIFFTDDGELNATGVQTITITD